MSLMTTLKAFFEQKESKASPNRTIGKVIEKGSKPSKENAKPGSQTENSPGTKMSRKRSR